MIIATFIGGLIALFVTAAIVSIALYILVPLVLGKGANAIGERLTGQSLNLGCFGYLLVAIAGAIVGHYLFGAWGPEIPAHGLHVIPAFLGSVIVVIVLQLVNRNRSRQY